MENLLAMTPIDKYADAIEKLALDKEGMFFTNEGADHAAIVMSNIFKTSKHIVRVFSGNLNSDVVNKQSYLEGLTNYFENRGKFHLLLESKPNNDSNAYEIILKAQENLGDKIKIKILNREIFPPGDFHFSVGDDRMFRFEKDPINYTAICSFNDKVMSQKFISIFDKAFNESKDLE